MKRLILVLLFWLPIKGLAVETTPYGKIIGIETRQGNLHIQTNFAAGSSLGCPVKVGDLYMFDFLSSEQGDGAQLVASVVLTAFAAGRDVSFHLYKCNASNNRPLIGHVRIK